MFFFVCFFAETQLPSGSRLLKKGSYAFPDGTVLHGADVLELPDSLLKVKAHPPPTAGASRLEDGSYLMPFGLVWVRKCLFTLGFCAFCIFIFIFLLVPVCTSIA